MSDLTPSEAPKAPNQWSSDELGEWIVEQTNNIAHLPERATVTKQLLTVLAAHMTENKRTSIPAEVYESEVVGAFLNLERRLVAVENALLASGANLPPASL